MLEKYKLEKLLQETYPNHKWNGLNIKFRKGIKASQRSLKVMVQNLFPESSI